MNRSVERMECQRPVERKAWVVRTLYPLNDDLIRDLERGDQVEFVARLAEHLI